MEPDPIRQAAELLAGASSIVISSGAGMSAESGVPTFRDENGYWSRFNPAELATVAAFRKAPARVWEWYRLRRQALAKVEPHAGHRKLAEWESRVPGFTVVTQNVDGLHHRAGSRNVVELHGRLDEVRCVHCAFVRRDLEDLGAEPHCPTCGDWLRPGVVWFGEMLPTGAFEQATAAVERCDVLIVIGTSGVVQPAASLAELAASHGAKVVEINPAETPISSLAHACVRSGCRDAIVEIDAAWCGISRTLGGFQGG
ncbi:MAG: NAD-dependent deacylase [Planctomycetes bacterium]|nr:NAD-dependent deacylase [Planctomycetota bacterium]